MKNLTILVFSMFASWWINDSSDAPAVYIRHSAWAAYAVGLVGFALFMAIVIEESK